MDKEFESKLRSIISRLDSNYRGEVQADIARLLSLEVNSFESLLKILIDKAAPMDARLAACWLLGQYRDKRAVRPLLQAFQAQDKRLYWEAAKSLGLIKSKRAVQPLMSALSGAQEVERRAASAYALGLLRDNRAVEPLLHVLVDAAEEPKVRGTAAEALSQMKDERIPAPLITSLRDPSVEVRFWSTYALGMLGVRRALPELERLAAKDLTVLPGWWSVSKEALNAIEQIRRGDKLDLPAYLSD